MTITERGRLMPITAFDKFETQRLLDDFCIDVRPKYSEFANVGQLEDWRKKLIHESLERKVENERAVRRRV